MIHTVPETGSTNVDLAARIGAGERIPEGDWLVADRQTQGKGRQGRNWSDGAGNFMGSTIVHVTDSQPAASSLAFVAALALHGAAAPLVEAPHRAMLKWPNDLLLNGAKLAGILLERVAETVIVGIGVNLKQAPAIEGRETIALAEIGPAPDRNHFAESIAAAFAQELDRWRSYGLEPILNRWQEAAHPQGTLLTVHDADGTGIRGTFAGLAPDGALQLRLADGSARAIHAGDVTL